MPRDILSTPRLLDAANEAQSRYRLHAGWVDSECATRGSVNASPSACEQHGKERRMKTVEREIVRKIQDKQYIRSRNGGK